MKRLFYKIITPFRTAYRFIVRPQTQGVKCLIEHKGRYLMIRNSYGHRRWTFPGGGVHNGELPEKAAQREALEEVGIQLSNIKSIGKYFTTRQYQRNTVHCFYTTVNNDFFQIDNDEVSGAEWFSTTRLPQQHSPAVEEVLRLWRSYSDRALH